jgi:hypothetical protein
MRIRSALLGLAVLVAGLAGGAGAAGATQLAGATQQTGATQRAGATMVAAAAPYCGITWGSASKSGGTLSQAPLSAVRTGRQACFDRVVFEFNGRVNGYSVHYGETYTEGEGLPLSPYTAGSAVLAVSLRAPAYDQEHASTFPYRTGAHVANVLRYRTLRDVVFGGSFEGYTTFAVGVRARLPYRVFVLSGPGTHSRIVLDVAHRWQA